MTSRHKLGCKLALATALVVCLAGCQQFGALFTKPQNQTPAPRDLLSGGEQESLGSVTSPQKADIQIAVARSLENEGRLDQAIKMYLDAVSKDDRRADAYHRLAVLHDKKGECQSAAKFYQESLKRDPGNAELHCDFGYSCYLQRRWGEAEASLRQAIALKPDLARAHNNLGLLLARTGRIDEALREFTLAGCAEADARANLAFALAMENNWLQAQRQFELALAVDPTSTAAKQGLDALRSVNCDSKSSDWRVTADRGSRIAARAAHTRWDGHPTPTLSR